MMCKILSRQHFIYLFFSFCVFFRAEAQDQDQKFFPFISGAPIDPYSSNTVKAKQTDKRKDKGKHKSKHAKVKHEPAPDMSSIGSVTTANDHLFSKNVERLPNEKYPTCRITYENRQYKVNKAALLLCFQNEIKNRSDYESISVSALATEIGSNQMNLDLLDRRAREVLAILNSYFNHTAVMISKTIAKERAVYVMLTPKSTADGVKDSTPFCAVSDYAPNKDPNSSFPNSAPAAQPVPCTPPTDTTGIQNNTTNEITPVSKSDLSVGYGRFYTQNTLDNLIPSQLNTYMISLRTDFMETKDIDAFYVGLLYMNSVTKSTDMLGDQVIYERSDLATFLGIDWFLQNTSNQVSFLFELGPMYSDHSLNISTSYNGADYKRFLALYLNGGAKIYPLYNFRSLFFRVNLVATYGQKENYNEISAQTQINPFTYGFLFEVGATF